MNIDTPAPDKPHNHLRKQVIKPIVKRRKTRHTLSKDSEKGVAKPKSEAHLCTEA